MSAAAPFADFPSCARAAKEQQCPEPAAHYWDEASLELLQRAGLAPGMRVLDLGCGDGGFSLLAAGLVGPEGSVLGIDRSPKAVVAAYARARAHGAGNAEFAISNVECLRLESDFDAVIGRFVLMYLTEPADALQRILRQAPAGCRMAFLEMDMAAARSVPAATSVESALEWIRGTFRRAEMPLDSGSQAWRILRQTGLPAPELMVRAQAEPAPAARGARYLADTVRTLLPMMEALGVASAAEVGIDTLAARLREECLSREATFFSPSAIGVWARKPAFDPFCPPQGRAGTR